MTADQVTLARELRAARTPWKQVARIIGVNVHTAIYHVNHKDNPRYVEARRRAWAKWSPKRDQGRAPWPTRA